MSEPRIIGAPQSNFVWAARIAFEEKGVPYRLIEAMPHAPEADAIHPLGKIPAMQHGPVVLGESRAICLYVDRAFAGPSLVPAEPADAARVEQWVSIIMTHVDPLLIRRYAGAYRGQIREGLALIEAALRMGRPGPYQLQAAIAAVHAEAAVASDTDWAQIAALYAELERMNPTPVIALNRAAAIGMSEGPVRGLELMDTLSEVLDRYHLFHAARADLLRRLGDR